MSKRQFTEWNCDRCRTRFEPELGAPQGSLQLHLGSDDATVPSESMIAKDLCPACCRELIDWFRTGGGRTDAERRIAPQGTRQSRLVLATQDGRGEDY